MAVVLAAGPEAVLSHASAAELWGLRTPVGLGHVPEITVPRDRKPRPRGIVVHRRSLPACDLTARAGIPITSPVRTLLDLAGRLSDARLEAAVSDADKLDLIDPETLRARLKDLDGERGAPSLRGLLDRPTFALTDSELERRFLRLASRAGLPPPETGVRLHGFKLDFLWRALGLVVETDGLRYHRTPAQQARDRRRDQALAAAGLTPLRFTHAQVVHETDEVERVLRSIHTRLASSRRTRARSR